MLATLGFGVTAVLFVAFAAAIISLAKSDRKTTFLPYGQAYGIVAAAFILWSVCSAIASKSLLALSVVIGDILLLVATMLIVSILLKGVARRNLWFWALGVAGVAALVVRTIYFYPKPYMTHGVLFFNSQRAVSFTLSAVFLLIWLPVNLQIARMLTQNVPSQERLFRISFATATLSTAIFLLSKTPLALSLSFTAISASFLVLILSTRYVKLLEERQHG
jgi:hypothetical protein